MVAGKPTETKFHIRPDGTKGKCFAGLGANPRGCKYGDVFHGTEAQVDEEIERRAEAKNQNNANSSLSKSKMEWVKDTDIMENHNRSLKHKTFKDNFKEVDYSDYPYIDKDNTVKSWQYDTDADSYVVDQNKDDKFVLFYNGSEMGSYDSLEDAVGDVEEALTE